MADQIPLHPVPRSTQRRAAYYTSAATAQRHNRYQVEDESSHLDEMPLMMSEEGFENDESDYHTLPRARISQRRRGLEWFICGGWKFLCTSCSDWLINVCRRKKELKARTVWLGCPEKCEEKYPKNAIKNQKYNIFTFIPGVLYEQFKFFLNLYFLVVSCSQFVPALKIGYLYTYWAPLTTSGFCNKKHLQDRKLVQQWDLKWIFTKAFVSDPIRKDRSQPCLEVGLFPVKCCVRFYTLVGE